MVGALELRITKETELADNDTIKKAPAFPLEPSSRSARRREKQKETQGEPQKYAFDVLYFPPISSFDAPSPF